MKINSDFKDLLRSVNAAGIRYLIVGGYAVMVHTEPRYTNDLDIWIDRDEQNARALLRALAEFGAPIGEVKPADPSGPGAHEAGVAGYMDLVLQYSRRPLATHDGTGLRLWSGRPMPGLAGDSPIARRMSRRS